MARLVRMGPSCFFGNAEVLEELVYLMPDIGVFELSGSRPKGDVFKHREVRKENVVLENQDNRILLGWFFVKEYFA